MLKIGADPEFWLVKRDTGRPVSADFLEGRLGTKTAPRKLDSGGGVQVDGTAVEFNIPPAETAGEFVDNMRLTLNEVRDLIPHQYAFDFSPFRTYTPAMWEKIPEKSKEIGCDPEQHVHFRPYVRRTKLAQRSRGVGGHLHFGWTEGKDTKDDPKHAFDCRHLASICAIVLPRAMRRLIGADARDERRVDLTGYGGNGAYRVKPYGMEYRTLSSRWVARPDVWKHVFDLCEETFELAQQAEFAYYNQRIELPEGIEAHTWMR